MSSARMEVDMLLNAKGVAEGANDAKKSLSDLEEAVGDVAAESARSGGKVDDFASKLVDASRKAGKSDDDIKDALRQMGLSARQAERAVEDIGDEFKETGRDGERAADKLEDSLRDVQKQSKKTEDSVDDIGGKGFGKLKEGAQEVTQEVGQNLGEAVSSIRGDLSDLGQVGQDTLGGLAATLAGSGPAGIAGAAALAAGAVGLGLVTAEIQEQNERVQKLKEYFAEAWQAAVEGGKEYIETATLVGEISDLYNNPEREKERNQIREDANKLGLDANVLIRAAAGDQESLNIVNARSNQLIEEQNELVTDSADIRTKGRGPKEAAAAQELADLESINDRWKQYGDISAEAQANAADAARNISDFYLNMASSADEAGVSIDAVGNKMIELPDGTTFFVSAETGQATTDLDTFQGDADGVIDHLNGRDIALSVSTGQALSAARAAVDEIANMTAYIKVRADVQSAINTVANLEWQ
ncbi:hypothetical protein ACTU6V_12325 [Microbacterium sp. A204]|uniref:hypothetical protein n=1 Tax=Microbacterium sp. A204 TaxID=3457321 RepID=UPI003FD0171D